MSLLILCLDTDSGNPATPTCTNGKLNVNATVSISGGATEAKQDTQITKLGAGLPAALTGSGNLKVAVAEALPAGTAVVGSVVPTNASGTALLPTPAALSNSTLNPTTTLVGSMLEGFDENGSGRWRRLLCDGLGRLTVNASSVTMGTQSRTSGSSYEAQRGISFSFSVAFLRVFLSPSYSNATLGGTKAYVLIIDKGSAAANGDTPAGADVFPIDAGSTIQADLSTCSEALSSGCQVVISDTPHQVTLPGANYGRFTIIGN